MLLSTMRAHCGLAEMGRIILTGMGLAVLGGIPGDLSRSVSSCRIDYSRVCATRLQHRRLVLSDPGNTLDTCDRKVENMLHPFSLRKPWFFLFARMICNLLFGRAAILARQNLHKSGTIFLQYFPPDPNKMVAGLKRKSLTSDDLMRRLENPAYCGRKRVRVYTAEKGYESNSDDKCSLDDRESLQMSNHSSTRPVEHLSRTFSSSDSEECESSKSNSDILNLGVFLVQVDLFHPLTQPLFFPCKSCDFAGSGSFEVQKCPSPVFDEC